MKDFYCIEYQVQACPAHYEIEQYPFAQPRSDSADGINRVATVERRFPE